MTSSYNALNTISINLSEIGICPTCGRRYSSDCEHAAEEQKALWWAAEQSNFNDKAPMPTVRNTSEPRTPEQIALDAWQAETEATRASDYPF